MRRSKRSQQILQSRPNLVLEVHPKEMHEWGANGGLTELCKLIHANEYEGTVIYRPDFGM
jgi:hypothetical protein